MDRNNQFNPQAELNFYDSLVKQPMPQEQLFVIFAYRAFALLKLGKEKEAAEILENVYRVRGGNEDQLSKLIEENLALSYLRLGERNNCVHNHSSESCIFPIQGTGFIQIHMLHKKPFSYMKIFYKKIPATCHPDGC